MCVSENTWYELLDQVQCGLSSRCPLGVWAHVPMSKEEEPLCCQPSSQGELDPTVSDRNPPVPHGSSREGTTGSGMA